ncbi:MAG: hypothetical protein ACHREM_06620 [Polyangiales bacterium]
MSDDVPFGVFTVVDGTGAFLGIASGSQATVRRTWGHRGTARFYKETAIVEGSPIAPPPAPDHAPIARAARPEPPPALRPLTYLITREPSKPSGRYVKDVAELEAHARAVVAAHPDEADRYRNGRIGVLGFFIAKVMECTQGGADPPLTKAALERALGATKEAT